MIIGQLREDSWWCDDIPRAWQKSPPLLNLQAICNKMLANCVRRGRLPVVSAPKFVQWWAASFGYQLHLYMIQASLNGPDLWFEYFHDHHLDQSFRIVYYYGCHHNGLYCQPHGSISPSARDGMIHFWNFRFDFPYLVHGSIYSRYFPQASDW